MTMASAVSVTPSAAGILSSANTGARPESTASPAVLAIVMVPPIPAVMTTAPPKLKIMGAGTMLPVAVVSVMLRPAMMVMSPRPLFSTIASALMLKSRPAVRVIGLVMGLNPPVVKITEPLPGTAASPRSMSRPASTVTAPRCATIGSVCGAVCPPV